MKKITKIVYLLLFATIFSCNDATDIKQEGIIYEENAFRTLKDFRSGVNGAYAAYGPDFGSDAIYFNDLFTDNMRRGTRNTGGGTDEYQFNLQPNSASPGQIWSNRYSTINRINRSLTAYDRLFPSFTTAEKREANHLKANLLALRALCHLDLFQYYTPDYLNATGPSVIKMDFVPANYKDVYPRNTVSQIADFIKADIDLALTLFDPASTSLTGVNYLGLAASNFIKCKITLFRGDYTSAQTIAQTVLTNLGSPALSNKTIYTNMYLDTAPGESFFTLSRISGNNGVVSRFYFNAGPADAIFEGSRQLYDLYASTDVRRDVNFRAVNYSAGEFPIGKYKGSGDGSFINDIKLFRLSELKLILAECKARNSNLSGAAVDVQDIRKARISASAPLPVYTSLNAALTDILLERRKEFPFEGHRYLDIKRLGKELNQGINRYPDDAATFSAQVGLDASDYRFTFPIPQSEVFANPTVEQNPKY
jgi:hypothetical protein